MHSLRPLEVLNFEIHVLFQCVPVTWNLMRGSHYCFIYWNFLMWLSWVVANRRDPGYVPQDTEGYIRAIKQVTIEKSAFDEVKQQN